MPGKFDGRRTRRLVCEALGEPSYEDYLIRLYSEGQSAPQIALGITKATGRSLTPRSIQRTLARLGKTRSIGEAFRLAMSQGRVQFQLNENVKRSPRQLNPRLRLKILARDNFTCQMCGDTRANGALLQVDHIIARVHGGNDEPRNLRVLCIQCNTGKRLVEREVRLKSSA